jgi:hypothetical protein
MNDLQKIKDLRRKELDTEARALRRLALRAERRGDSASLNVAALAREKRLQVLKEIFELDVPAENSPDNQQNSGNPASVKAILTKVCWTGAIEDSERDQLLKLGIIDAKDKVPLTAAIGLQERVDVMKKFFMGDAPKPKEPEPQLEADDDDKDKKPN